MCVPMLQSSSSHLGGSIWIRRRHTILSKRREAGRWANGATNRPCWCGIFWTKKEANYRVGDGKMNSMYRIYTSHSVLVLVLIVAIPFLPFDPFDLACTKLEVSWDVGYGPLIHGGGFGSCFETPWTKRKIPWEVTWRTAESLWDDLEKSSTPAKLRSDTNATSWETDYSTLRPYIFRISFVQS